MSESLGAGRPGRVEREFRLAGRLVQPELNRIRHDGEASQVEPKVMQVLLRLCERPGEVVGKQELIESVWQGVFVTEDVLVRAVRELRRLFGDDAETPRVIETIRTRGYRLIAPIVYEMAREPGWADAARAAPKPRRSILPLAVMALVAILVPLGAAWLILPSRKSPRHEPRFVPLTSLAGNEFDPALSPDGTRVAFTWDGGQDGRPLNLYVKMIDAEPPLRLTSEDGGDRAAVWSPDGSRIAFLRHRPGACEIRVVNALGGPSQLLAPCTNPDHPRFAWSPDGGRLYVSHGGSASAGLAVRDVATGATTELTEAAPGHFDTAPVLSPDGQQLAFLRNYSDSVGDAWVMPAAGGRARPLTSDSADIIGIAWIEGGRALALSSNRAGMYSLWRVPLAGGAPALLAGGGRKMKHPSASRDGRQVAYEAWNYDMNLWRVPLGDGGAPARVAPASDEWTFEPQFSPDGERIAFVSTRSGSYELWTCDRDGSRPQRLTSFGGAYVGAPRWSRDGQIAFQVRRSGPAETWLVSGDGGSPRMLETGPGEAIAPSFSADGGTIYFGTRRSGSWEVMAFPVGGGTARVVTTSGGYAASESPDGRWLYHSRIDHAGLWRLPSGGGGEEQVTDRLQPENWAGWTVTASHVYWIEQSPAGGRPVLVRQPVAGGRPETVASLPDVAWPGIAIAPDGREVVYSRVEHHESNLVGLQLSPRR
jgi:Tol biopolymer transport system component/DNA-binding winged helix-turn-helix (wHTH) protein